MEEVMKLDSVDKYNKLFGLETRHPLVSVVDLSQATQWPEHIKINYGVYALYLKDTYCGNILYGRQSYDYQEGTIVSFAPGQVTETEMQKNVRPKAHGILFHPDLIRGTALGQEIKNYSFFSYATREALHLSEEERATVMDCLHKIEAELKHSIDKHSRRLICANIGLLLDYCMRFYERQFIVREPADELLIQQYENLVEQYIGEGKLAQMPLTSACCAEQLHLSEAYFNDLLFLRLGHTHNCHIQLKRIELAKARLRSSGEPVSRIVRELGFPSVQYFCFLFKKITGTAPNEYRWLN